MIDRAHQDVNLESEVVLTGLVPQLTTPSRDRGDLVDIWFGVQWRERNAEWEETFARLATGWRPDPLSPSCFDLFSYAANSGLIVARRVRADARVWRQVEEQARLLVGRVNGDVIESADEPIGSVARMDAAVRDASSGLLASLRWSASRSTPCRRSHRKIRIPAARRPAGPDARLERPLLSAARSPARRSRPLLQPGPAPS